ncbi:hypothetical protein [Actinokineospora sp. NBRC 105648]|uniref:hypothetical protein n=1 Tax=Actinokineospora sp. NBRC 105648 TaxID=3032206 RepID=UPI0024A0FA25|nr:hypothetical protein [Actinokineospora sp. NBRC 105648]GLZ40254.1 hypothetical protein Acsp05_38780 [Actinokineospora sp. NBRC 105648]
MSDSFMVAARIELSRAAFDVWLSSVPGPEVITNPDRMFDGWYWDGDQPAAWSDLPTGRTPREFFADQVDAADSGTATLLRYRDGALEAYLFFLGYDKESVHTALLMLAGAGVHAAAEQTVLFWAETSGSLLTPDGAWLSVLSAGRDGARFVRERDLTGVVASLRPVEQGFFDLVDRLAEEEEEHDPDEPFPARAAHDPGYLDPAVLATS